MYHNFNFKDIESIHHFHIIITNINFNFGNCYYIVTNIINYSFIFNNYWEVNFSSTITTTKMHFIAIVMVIFIEEIIPYSILNFTQKNL